MDLVSHGLVGGLVASWGLRKYGLVVTTTMVLANLAPDIDAVAGIFGLRYWFKYHRGVWFHSIGGTALLSLVITALVCIFTPFKRVEVVFSISLIGMVLHLLSDLLNPWPIPALFPFSSKEYSLDLVSFFDPILMGLLVADLVGTRYFESKQWWVLLVMLFLVGGYLGFRGYTKNVARSVVTKVQPATSISILPHGFNPFTWDAILTDKGNYHYYLVDSWRRITLDAKTLQSEGDEQSISASKNSGLVKSFLKRARFPLVSATKEGDKTIVLWRDLHLIVGGGAVRGVVVVLDEQGAILEERFELNRA